MKSRDPVDIWAYLPSNHQTMWGPVELGPERSKNVISLGVSGRLTSKMATPAGVPPFCLASRPTISTSPTRARVLVRT